jgi:hypothetical protein
MESGKVALKKLEQSFQEAFHRLFILPTSPDH